MQELRWAFSIARRDAVGSFRRVLFFIVVAALAVSVFATITSLRQSVSATLTQEGKALLGTDAILESKSSLDSLDPQLSEKDIAAIARSADFRSMARFNQLLSSSFVQVFALEPSFPHYGTPQVEPSDAWQALSKRDVALVDQQLLIKHNLKLGDAVQIGDLELKIVGSVINLPGDNALRSLFAPRVYIPYAQLEETNLLRKGSWISYKRYLRFSEMSQATWLEEFALQNNLRLSTTTSKENQASEIIATTYRFLSLIAMIAAILAIVGIVSIMQSYTVTNRKIVATLRCLGASKFQILALFLIQYLLIAVISWLIGAASSFYLVTYLAKFVSQYYPQLNIITSDPVVLLQSLGVAIIISFSGFLLLLADWPHFHPAQALRLGADAPHLEQQQTNQNLLLIISGSLLPFILLSVGFDWQLLLAFVLLLLALILLTALGRFLQSQIGKIELSWAAFSWRYALHSMRRIDSLSTMLLISIGVTMLLCVAVEIIRQSFFQELSVDNINEQANILAFDIQTDQLQLSRNIFAAHSSGVIDEAPMVAMRLLSVNGIAVQELARQKNEKDRWAYSREYRSSYRSTLNDGELLLSGTLPSTVNPNAELAIPVTLEKRIAEELSVNLGDKLTFNVQGLEITTIVSGIRKANWRKLQPNVFVLFPPGVLEDAPQMFIQTAQLNSEQEVIDLQRNFAQQLPNVTIIDLRSLAKTVAEISNKLLAAIAILAAALFVIAIICLFQSILAARQARVAEERTLYSLGASRQQLRRIAVIETLILVFCATCSGAILGVIAGVSATSKLLQLTPTLEPAPLLAILAILFATAVSASSLSFAKQ